MPKGMQAIYSRTFTSNANGMTFNNIPQTYTDLLIKLSTKSTSPTQDIFGIYLNGSQANFNNTSLNGTGGSYNSGRSTYRAVGQMAGTDYTSNAFSNYDIYIPDYTSTKFKQIIVDGVIENNATTSAITLVSNLVRTNAPIKSFQYDSSTHGVVQLAGTTITLYGISR